MKTTLYLIGFALLTAGLIISNGGTIFFVLLGSFSLGAAYTHKTTEDEYKAR